MKVQFVQVTFELTVRTTPGSSVIVQLLQLLIAPNKDVEVLAGMDWDLAVMEQADSRTTVDRRVIKSFMGNWVFEFTIG